MGSKAAHTTTDRGPTRREAILAAAAQVFARKGVAGATVRDIADEANILSGSLYHHFDSKDQMVEEILRVGFDVLAEGYRRAFEAGLPAAGTVRALLTAGVEFVMGDPIAGRIIRGDSRQLEAQARFAFISEYKARFHDDWLALLERGVRDGEFRADLDAEIAYYAMVDAVLGTVRYAVPERSAPSERVAARLGDVFVRGLQP